MPSTRHPTADLLALHGFGPKALRILREGPGTRAEDCRVARTRASIGTPGCHTDARRRPLARLAPHPGIRSRMPEGHTLFALARDLHEAFAGTTPEVTSPQGKFDEGAAELTATGCSAPPRAASTCSSSSPTTAGCTCTSA